MKNPLKRQKNQLTQRSADKRPIILQKTHLSPENQITPQHSVELATGGSSTAPAHTDLQSLE